MQNNRSTEHVFGGLSVDNRDHWRDRDAMPFRLRSFHYASGEKRQDDPARPVLHGLSAADGRLYAACEDGSILCFGE